MNCPICGLEAIFGCRHTKGSINREIIIGLLFVFGLSAVNCTTLTGAHIAKKTIEDKAGEIRHSAQK